MLRGQVDLPEAASSRVTWSSSTNRVTEDSDDLRMPTTPISYNVGEKHRTSTSHNT